MPTAAVCTMSKWIGLMPMRVAIGNTTGISTTAAGRPSSTMPNTIVISATPSRNIQCADSSGFSNSPSSTGTPVTPIRYWKTVATASRNTTTAVNTALS